MAQRTLQTERLTLVPLAEEHLELEVELDSDPDVMRYLLGRAAGRAEVEDRHRQRLASADERPGLGFWIGFTGTARDDFVGWWLLRPPHGPDQPPEAGDAELGYRLLKRQWRRGYASEGARSLIAYGFEVMRLQRVFAQAMAVNVGSRATMCSAGMTFVRSFITALEYEEAIDGAEQGEVEYAITRAQWLAAR